MATVRIPTDQILALYEEQVELDGTTFRLVFQWNARDSAWYLDILTADDVRVRSSVKIVADFPLLRLLTGSDRPPGEMIAVGNGIEAKIDTLGTDVPLVYIEAA